MLGLEPSRVSTMLAAASISAVSIISLDSFISADGVQRTLEAINPVLLSDLLAVTILSQEVELSTSVVFAPHGTPFSLSPPTRPPVAQLQYPPSLPQIGDVTTISALRADSSKAHGYCQPAWSVPGSCSFGLFALWIAPPLTAAVTMGAVLSLRVEPHFSGFADALAAIPLALLVCACGVKRRLQKRRAVIALKTGTVALIEGMHYWHTVLYVSSTWARHGSDTGAAWKGASLALLLLPGAISLVAVVALVVVALRQQPGVSLLDPTVVRAHPRGVSVVLLLAALHIELLALLPWRTTSCAGFPTRGVLVGVVCLLLLQKVSMLVLSAHFVFQVESSAFGVYIFVFSAVWLLQLLLEKAMLAMSVAGLEAVDPVHDRTDSPGAPAYLAGAGTQVAGRERMSAADRAEAEAVRRASEEASLDVMRDHLREFLRSNGPDASFKAWIAMLHPENVRLDSRMDSVDSWHLQLWDEMREEEGEEAQSGSDGARFEAVEPGVVLEVDGSAGETVNDIHGVNEGDVAGIGVLAEGGGGDANVENVGGVSVGASDPEGEGTLPSVATPEEEQRGVAGSAAGASQSSAAACAARADLRV